ncbi:hypothetical protein ACN20G_04435 [Streptomyces sp. BI20]|uniref:hypothetical protein n=1 Tax=Streptomyces sp. BI20 TaxID=3403460 RepID=UPI003C792C2E
MGRKSTQGTEPYTDLREALAEAEAAREESKEKPKLDLSLTQIVGSSLATVAAALLASELGVYGTILGAGVVSVVATAGGPVIQHLFRRGGAELRDATRPKARQVPLPDTAADPARTAMFPAADPTLAQGAPVADPYGTPPAFGAHGTGAPYGTPRPPGDGEFGAPTTHASGTRRWKRTAIGAALTFAVAMGGIVTYELVADKPFGASDSSVTGAVTGGGYTSGAERKANEEKKEKEGEKGGRKENPGTLPSGDSSPGSGTGGDKGEEGKRPEPSGSPSTSTPPTTPTPGPSASPSQSVKPPVPPTPDPEPSGDTSKPPAGGGAGGAGGAGEQNADPNAGR